MAHPAPPLARLQRWGGVAPEALAELERLATTCDPFALSLAIDRQVDALYALASRRYRQPRGPTPGNMSKLRDHTIPGNIL